MDIQQEIRDKAKELLSTNAVTCILGYEMGTLGVRPAFVYKPEEADWLVWNEQCTYNLVNYLRDKRGKKVAMVVKPCDSRALNILLHEGQVKREEVYIIGIPCQGTLWKGQADPRCALCAEHVPSVYDVMFGEKPAVAVTPDAYEDVAKYEAMSPTERETFWQEQFDKCIRCYACRQVCPMCNCPTCLYERDDSTFVGMGIGLNEKRTFHLGRAYHLAGRCVGCNECERACPMEIPISLLNQKLAGEIEKAFGHRAGLTVVPSPIVTVLSGEYKEA